MTLLSGILSLAALGAAVGAVAQLARQSIRLRSELDELQSAKIIPAAGASRTDAPVMFGGLYDSKPGPFEVLGEWPGVPLAIAAAGLFAVGLFTNRPLPAGRNDADSTIAHDIAAARLQYDSLAREVSALRDSLKVMPRAAHAAAPAAATRGKPVRTTALAQPKPAADAGAIAPLPSLPKVSP